MRAGEGGLSTGWDEPRPWLMAASGLCRSMSGVTLGKSVLLYETPFSHLPREGLLLGAEVAQAQGGEQALINGTPTAPQSCCLKEGGYYSLLEIKAEPPDGE